MSPQIAILCASFIDTVFTMFGKHYTDKVFKSPYKRLSLQPLFQSIYSSSALYLFIVLLHSTHNVELGHVPGQVELLNNLLLPATATITLLSALKLTVFAWLAFILPTIDLFFPVFDPKSIQIVVISLARFLLMAIVLISVLNN